MQLKNIYIIGLILIMITQTIHTFSVFMSFSKIKQKWLMISQGVIFCSIFSLLTMAFALDGRTWLALAMSFIEAGINVYYYFIDFWQNGFGRKNDENRKMSIVRYWRRNWIVWFAFAVVIPASIFVLSHLLKLNV